MKKTEENKVLLELRKHPPMKTSEKIQKGLANVHIGMPYEIYVEVDDIPIEETYDTMKCIHIENESGLINRQYRDYVELRQEWDPVEGYRKKLIDLCGDLISKNDMIS